MSCDPARRATQPSRAARRTGYRTDSGAHEDARDLVEPARRAEIASMGGFARADALYGSYGQKSSGPHAPASPRAQRQAAPGPAAPPAQRRTGRPPAIAGTPAQVKAARAARAAASRPARRAAAKAAAKRGMTVHPPPRPRKRKP